MHTDWINHTFWIAAPHFPTADAKIKALAYRANKLGIAPITYHVTGRTETRKAASYKTDGKRLYENLPVSIVYHEVVVSGAAPQVAGWEFIAKLEHAPGIGTIVKAVPGREIPKRYRKAVSLCEHCGTTRRRNDTFLLRHADTGKYKQVGRTCLKDFLGHDNPEAYAKMCETYVQIIGLAADYCDDEFDGEGRLNLNGIAFSLEPFLACAIAAIEKYGYVKTADRDFNEPTRNTALDLFFPGKGKPIKVTPAQRKLAKRVVNHFKRVAAGKSDYMANAKLFAAAGTFTLSNAGIVASMPAVYLRHQEEQRKAKGPKAANAHFGTVGKREEFTITIHSKTLVDGLYGTTTLVKFADDKGRSGVWFASGYADDLSEGKTYRIKGTVKKHDVFKETKQTSLSRVAVQEEIKKARAKRLRKAA